MLQYHISTSPIQDSSQVRPNEISRSMLTIACEQAGAYVGHEGMTPEDATRIASHTICVSQRL